jgi:hypothetical protein
MIKIATIHTVYQAYSIAVQLDVGLSSYYQVAP